MNLIRWCLFRGFFIWVFRLYTTPMLCSSLIGLCSSCAETWLIINFAISKKKIFVPYSFVYLFIYQQQMFCTFVFFIFINNKYLFNNLSYVWMINIYLVYFTYNYQGLIYIFLSFSYLCINVKHLSYISITKKNCLSLSVINICMSCVSFIYQWRI
jgi:hypothetical protein